MPHQAHSLPPILNDGRHRFPGRLGIGEESQGLQDALAMTVFVYVNTSKQVGDAEHVKVFATTDAAGKWLEESDPEGVAFEYEVLE